MHLLIVFVALEILAMILVVALCMAARRGDKKTERALSCDETTATQIGSDLAPPEESATAGKLSISSRLGTLFRSWGRNKYSE
jgi:hypothetical protein